MSLLSKLPNVRGKYRENADLSKLCWFRTGGNAEVLYIPEDAEDLAYFLSNKTHNVPIFVLGIGSNVLIRDGGIPGVVIRLGKNFGNIKLIDEESRVIGAGATALDINVAMFAMTQCIGGFEFLSGIPGTVGGAIAMNAGAYGNEISQILLEVDAIDLNGSFRTFGRSDIEFAYRENYLRGHWIFVGARFQGYESTKKEIVQKIDYIQEVRNKTQPLRLKTGGSTFKNPPGQKAWQLIDNAECRGLKIGGAQVSTLHCNFFINEDNASSSDLEDLINVVKKRVYDQSNVMLEEEIMIVGEEKV